MVRSATKTEETKETTMKTLNLKAVASAFAALFLTLVLSWTFLDATSLAHMQSRPASGFVVAASAMLR